MSKLLISHRVNTHLSSLTTPVQFNVGFLVNPIRAHTRGISVKCTPDICEDRRESFVKPNWETSIIRHSCEVVWEERWLSLCMLGGYKIIRVSGKEDHRGRSWCENEERERWVCGRKLWIRWERRHNDDDDVIHSICADWCWIYIMWREMDLMYLFRHSVYRLL